MDQGVEKQTLKTDIAIIGGGPSGSTCGGFLKKYGPDTQVLILEREKFPRDHIGESQLPLIGSILHELGVWDRVEAADFPIKIGATYRWGTTENLWDFDFLPYGKFDDEARPGKYEGQRRYTAFQVDRARYDKILLDFAEELGCEWAGRKWAPTSRRCVPDHWFEGNRAMDLCDRSDSSGRKMGDYGRSRTEGTDSNGEIHVAGMTASMVRTKKWRARIACW